MPLCDVRAQYDRIRGEIDRAVHSVIQSGRFIGGTAVADFEASFARFCGTRLCVGTSSGTSALALALRALGVGPGDEVITPALTFIATAAAVHQAGARPVLADIEPATMTLDPARVERALTPRTKALLPVHLFGLPADMPAIREIAEKRNLLIVEDAAQAHGAEACGGRVGGLGHAGCFSFFPSKNLGAFGDAGAMVTDDEGVANRTRMLGNHGRRAKYLHGELGSNDRLDALQAAVLSVKLNHLEKWTEERRRAAQWYREALDGLPLRLPAEPEGRRCVYHLFVIRTPERDRIREALAEEGIETGIHYDPPLHLQPALANLPGGGGRPGEFPEAERAAREVLSLPLYPELTQEQVRQIAAVIARTLGS
ncbi:MAG: DegT/DnrJ/EryC1/StrS family aminotransferase [Candidatus Tectomicrobia bacterium]|nr:DegT/DnrJ/EryC1/StrS family aminotransferase [Candidatus Tectomicrobia bacterium]